MLQNGPVLVTELPPSSVGVPKFDLDDGELSELSLEEEAVWLAVPDPRFGSLLILEPGTRNVGVTIEAGQMALHSFLVLHPPQPAALQLLRGC